MIFAQKVGVAILVAYQVRMPKKWATSLAFSSAMCLFLPSLPANASGVNENGRRAEIVVDAETGAVLHEQNATLLRHPASITKVMTLYLLFDAVESGRLSLDDRITFSRNADRQPATDLGTRAGDSISVETAILALICRSANDVATAVAEHLGGTESGFANQMTERAHSLGMNDTNFENASGLPNRGQISTAEDIAKLAIAIRRDFPRQFHWFSRQTFEYNGQQMNNHNHLVGVISGVDGLKTGFTSSSGYNLAATATRDGHRIVTVVMGGTNWRERDARVGSLIETAYSNLGIHETSPTYASISAYNSYSETDQRDGADIEGLISEPTSEFRITNAAPVNVAFTNNGRVIGQMPSRSEAVVQMAAATPSAAPQVFAATQTAATSQEAATIGDYAALADNQSAEPLVQVAVVPAVNEMPADIEAPATSEAAAIIDIAPVVMAEEQPEATEIAPTMVAQQAAAEPSDAVGSLLAAMADKPQAIPTEQPAIQIASFTVPTAADEIQTTVISPEILAMRAEAAERERLLLAEAIALEDAEKARQDAVRQAQIRQAMADEHERELAIADHARQERAAAVRLERERQAANRQVHGNVTVQVGAFRARGQAQDLVSRMAHNFPSVARPEVSRVTTSGGTWFRARFTGMAAAAARDACRIVIRSGASCEIVTR